MRILVTGSSGFIGHNLIASLLLKGYEVVGIDNKHGREINADPNFKFELGDVKSIETMSKVIRRYKPDLVIHLAARKIPRYGNRLDTLLVNGIASESVFQSASDADVGVLFASTSDVYGMNSEIPFGHESNLVSGPPDVARWSYSVSKLFSEHLLHGYYERERNPSAIIRFFGAYGPHNSLDWTGGPIPVFINAAFQNKPIEIHGDGKQTRTFSYIGDHVNGIISILDKWPFESLQTFNFGSTNEISIVDLAAKVWSTVNVDVEPLFNFVPYKSFGNYQDVMRRVPKMDQTVETLGEHWKTSLQEGLTRTIEWQRSFKDC